MASWHNPVMLKARVSIIAAIGKNRELGKNNELLWRISEDLKRVKALTMGHPIIMGRKTHESIGRPLPGRTNMIVSRQPGLKTEGCYVYESFDAALLAAGSINQDEVFIFGGAEIYREAFPYAKRLYLTRINARADADVFFPAYEKKFVRVIEKEKRDQDGLAYEWVTLEK